MIINVPVSPSIPRQITGSNPITVTNSNGVLEVGLDLDATTQGPLGTALGFSDTGDPQTQTVGDVGNPLSIATVAAVPEAPWSSSQVGSVERPIGDKLSEISYSLIDAGGVPNNPAIDNTAAINKWLSQLLVGRTLELPDGLFYFKSPTSPVVGANYIRIFGKGTLVYNGASGTPTDLLTFGDNVSGPYYVDLRGWSMFTRTVLTGGGFALRIRRGAKVELDLTLGEEYGGDYVNGEFFFYKGIYLERTSITNAHSTSNFSKAIRWLIHDAVELKLGHAQNKAPSGAADKGISVYCAGGVGGVYGENSLSIFARVHLAIDNSLSAAENQQFYMNSAGMDQADIADIYVNDTSGVNYIGKTILLDGFTSSSTAAGGKGLHIKQWGGKVTANGEMCNHNSDAIYNEDPDVRLTIGAAADISKNGGYAVNSTVPITIRSFAQPFDNAAGNYSPNVSVRNDAHGMMPLKTRVTTEYAMDGDGLTLTIPGGGTAVLNASYCGVFFVNCPTSGQSAQYVTGNGVAVGMQSGSPPTFIANSGSPGAAEIALNLVGGGYTFYNGFAAAQTIRVTPLLRLRNSL